MFLREMTGRMREGANLSRDEVCTAVERLVAEDIPPEEKADFLTALADKGETDEELAFFALELREMAVRVPLAEDVAALDVCGTGGDGLNTFNISTTVAILCAAAGVPVAKHGNRAITSQSGSADVLNALGIPTDLSPEDAATSIQERNFAFLFAPMYHPAFKHIAPARKLCAERGQRTLFNFLGPLLNPARPRAQLIGVPRADLCGPMARVLQQLGIPRGMVVCGQAEGRAMDELSILGSTTVAEFYQEGAFAESELDPAILGLPEATLSELEGGDAEANAGHVRAVLNGSDTGARRSAVVLNAGAALMVADRAKSIAEGMELARSAIDDGRAAAKLAELAA